MSQFTCSFPDKKQIRPVKGEEDSGYLFPMKIDSKYAGEKLSVIKGREVAQEWMLLQVLTTDWKENQANKPLWRWLSHSLVLV